MGRPLFGYMSRIEEEGGNQELVWVGAIPPEEACPLDIAMDRYPNLRGRVRIVTADPRTGEELDVTVDVGIRPGDEDTSSEPAPSELRESAQKMLIMQGYQQGRKEAGEELAHERERARELDQKLLDTQEELDGAQAKCRRLREEHQGEISELKAQHRNEMRERRQAHREEVGELRERIRDRDEQIRAKRETIQEKRGKIRELKRELAKQDLYEQMMEQLGPTLPHLLDRMPDLVNRFMARFGQEPQGEEPSSGDGPQRPPTGPLRAVLGLGPFSGD